MKCSGEDVVFTDLAVSLDALEAIERAVPRLSAGDERRAGAESGEAVRIWRGARIATRIALERWVGPAIRGCEFVIETGGRPRLQEPPPYFSVAHSGTGVLIAIASSGPIGADIETRRTLSISADRRQRLLNANGRLGDDDTRASSTPAPDSADPSDAAVLRAWVRLEAVAKAEGGGIGRLLTREGVVGGQGSEGAAGGDARAQSLPLDVRDLTVPDGFVAAVAGAGLPRDISVLTLPTEAVALALFLGS